MTVLLGHDRVTVRIYEQGACEAVAMLIAEQNISVPSAKQRNLYLASIKLADLRAICMERSEQRSTP
ncbi:MAG TPA: hypothetical protein PLO50_12095 [Nitrospira sp.]|nr:hypothetical protein [Nitrospira sp.]